MIIILWYSPLVFYVYPFSVIIMNKTNNNNEVSSFEKRHGTLHITQKVDYGMFLLAAIASHGSEDPISLHDVADGSNLSFAFLQQVARQLRQGGLLESVRGKSGGYRLTRKANNISVKQIIEALEGPVAITDCAREDDKHPCPRSAVCSMRTAMRRINDEIKDVLERKTLDHFMATK